MAVDYTDSEAVPVLDPTQWPRYVFHRTQPPALVQNPDEEAALGPGWQRTPYTDEEAQEPEPEPGLEPEPKAVVRIPESRTMEGVRLTQHSEGRRTKQPARLSKEEAARRRRSLDLKRMWNQANRAKKKDAQ